MRARAVTAGKVAACAVLVWFLWQQPGAAVFKAVLYALVAWACATVVVAGLYFAVSLDDFRDVLLATLSTASAAMWLVPAVLLLSMHIPGLVAVALLLIANTMRLLFARGAPQERGMARMRGVRPEAAFAGGILPLILCAVAFQLAAVMGFAGYPVTAAALVALAAAILTSISVARGAYRRNREARRRFSLLSIVLTLLLASALGVREVAADSEGASPAGVAATAGRIVHELVRGRAPAPSKQAVALLARPKAAVRKFTPQANQVPGVILRPDTKPRREAVALRVAGRTLALAGPVTFPFTGEYHLFPTSSGGVQRDSVVHRGTPLEFLYASASGGSVETEAYQGFDPPFDFSGCGKVLLRISSGEVTPALAVMELEVAGGGVVEVGTGVFGMEAAADETLEFEVPVGRVGIRASGMRVIFRRDPSGAFQTSRVAIRDFTLLPRGR